MPLPTAKPVLRTRPPLLRPCVRVENYLWMSYISIEQACYSLPYHQRLLGDEESMNLARRLPTASFCLLLEFVCEHFNRTVNERGKIDFSPWGPVVPFVRGLFRARLFFSFVPNPHFSCATPTRLVPPLYPPSVLKCLYVCFSFLVPNFNCFGNNFCLASSPDHPPLFFLTLSWLPPFPRTPLYFCLLFRGGQFLC